MRGSFEALSISSDHMQIISLGNTLLGLYSTPEDDFKREDSRLTQVVNKLLRRFGVNAESFLTSDMQHKERQLVMQLRNISWHQIAHEIRSCGIHVVSDVELKPQETLSRSDETISLNDTIMAYCDRSGFNALDIEVQNLRHMVSILNITPVLVNDSISEHVVDLDEGIPRKGSVYIASNEWWTMQSDEWKAAHPEFCVDEDRFMITEIVDLTITDEKKIVVKSRKILLGFPQHS